MMARVGFDAQGHLLIGERPRWVLGVYASGGGFSLDSAYFEHLFFAEEEWSLHGIPVNVVLPYWEGNMSWESTRVVLDVLAAHGVSFLLTCNGFEDGSWRRLHFSASDEGYVRSFAQHPAALGYYLCDECGEGLIPETLDHYRQLKAWDPEGVAFIANYAVGYRDPARWVDACDILGTDPYPVYNAEPARGYPHFTVAEFVSKLRAAVPAHRPVWAVLQFFRGSNEARLPTPDEMRAHAIMAIVEGAAGILWWDVGSSGLRQENAATVVEYMGHLRTLVNELASLEPALLTGNLNAALQNSTRFPDPVAGRIAQLQHSDSVEWLWSRKEMYRAEIAALQAGDRSKSGGMLEYAATIRTRAMVDLARTRGYVFAYNYTNQSQVVTFDVPGFDLRPYRIWENKSGQNFPIRGGAAWSDTFAPYEAKVYVIGQ